MTEMSDQEIDPDTEYTVTKAAEFLGVDVRSVRRWCDKDLLESRRLSPALRSPRRIPGQSIIDFMASR